MPITVIFDVFVNFCFVYLLYCTSAPANGSPVIKTVKGLLTYFVIVFAPEASTVCLYFADNYYGC